MIKTITFTDVDKRNDYISIVKELWFTVNTNTYSKNSSVTHTSIYDWRWGSTTRHNSTPQYEINIEKEIDYIDEEDKESKELDKLKKIFFYKEKKESFMFHLFIGTLSGFFITAILVWPILWGIFGIDELLINTGLVYLIGLFICLHMVWVFNKSYKKEKAEAKKEINNLKDELINSYLWKKWKEIIKKYN